MRASYSSATHVGQRRSHNEDFHHVDDKAQLFIVCDGMGGHAAGEVASRMAVDAFVATVRGAHAQITSGEFDPPTQAQMALETVERAAHHANEVVHEASIESAERAGMGTTLTALYVVGNQGYVAHVGDSRLYVRRGEQVHQVTDDHTVANKMIRAGRLRPDEAHKLKSGGALTRAVGVYPRVEVDTLAIDVLPDDLFLICSDGLYRYFGQLDLNAFLTHTSVQTGADSLVSYANSSGGRDNITAILVKFTGGAETLQTLRVRLTIAALRDVPFFKYLTYAELLRVIGICETVEVTAGTRVIEYGAVGREFYLLLEGRAKVHRDSQVLTELESGAHFGEMSLIDNQPRSASVTTLTKAVLIRIQRDDFFKVLRDDSVLAVKLLWNFVQTLTGMVRSGNEGTIAERLHPYGEYDE